MPKIVGSVLVPFVVAGFLALVSPGCGSDGGVAGPGTGGVGVGGSPGTGTTATGSAGTAVGAAGGLDGGTAGGEAGGSADASGSPGTGGVGGPGGGAVTDTGGVGTGGIGAGGSLTTQACRPTGRARVREREGRMSAAQAWVEWEQGDVRPEGRAPAGQVGGEPKAVALELADRAPAGWGRAVRARAEVDPEDPRPPSRAGLGPEQPVRLCRSSSTSGRIPGTMVTRIKYSWAALGCGTTGTTTTSGSISISGGSFSTAGATSVRVPA